ncbi:ATP-binding protein [Pseudoduganella lurida]|nr:ATPase [Pseudoduganella lurida]
MVGRAEVIGMLAQAVGVARLVSIVGAGGIGKTTVALAVAGRSLEAFPDGVWFVDFAPLRDGALVPHAIASATGLVVHAGDVLAALCRSLRARRVLLLLDNCEHLAPAIAPCVARLLEEAPGVHVLATSRAALRIGGEQAHRLAGLACPPEGVALTAAQALDYAAVALFAERARDRAEGFVLADDDAAAAADICRRLDGIALAIELAAMRVDSFGVQGLQSQLGDRFRLLGSRRAGLERHRTLLATLDWSYGLLPAAEAALLRAIAVFPGAFRIDGAARVAGLPADAARAMLAELAAKSLLSGEADGEPVYRALETTRVHCLDKLALAGEEQTVRQRHAAHVCAAVQQAAAAWGERPSREWGAAYGGLLDDLRAALAWTQSAAGQSRLQIDLTAAGILLWNHFSLTDESRGHLAGAIARLDAAGCTGTVADMHLHFALAGAILYTCGTGPEVRAAIGRALALSERLADTDFRLRCLRLTSTIELFSGEHDAGMRTLATFLSIASTDDPSALAEGETHLGVGEIFTGRLLDARRRMERLAAQQAQDFNDARFVRFQYSNSVNILVVLSHAQWLTGQTAQAADMAQTILAYGRAANHELSLSIALAWNCLLFFWLGQDDACAHHTAMLDELVEQHGIVTWRPIVTFCRGALAVRGTPDSLAGIDEMVRAIAQFRATGHRARLPYYLAVLAEALGRQGRLHEAAATLDDALALAAVQNEQWCMPELLRIQAFLATARGEPEAAQALLRHAIALTEQTGGVSWQRRIHEDLAAVTAQPAAPSSPQPPGSGGGAD